MEIGYPVLRLASSPKGRKHGTQKKVFTSWMPGLPRSGEIGLGPTYKAYRGESSGP